MAKTTTSATCSTTDKKESRNVEGALPRQPARQEKTMITPNNTSPCQPRGQIPPPEPKIPQGLKKCTNDKLVSPSYPQLHDKTTVLAQGNQQGVSLQIANPRIRGRRENPRHESTNHTRHCAAPQPPKTRPYTNLKEHKHTYKKSPDSQLISHSHNSPHYRAVCDQKREHTKGSDLHTRRLD